jgi:hypothetical protein
MTRLSSGQTARRPRAAWPAAVPWPAFYKPRARLNDPRRPTGFLLRIAGFLCVFAENGAAPCRSLNGVLGRVGFSICAKPKGSRVCRSTNPPSRVGFGLGPRPDPRVAGLPGRRMQKFGSGRVLVLVRVEPVSAPVDSGLSRRPLSTAIRNGASKRPLEATPRDGPFQRPFETAP